MDANNNNQDLPPNQQGINAQQDDEEIDWEAEAAAEGGLAEGELSMADAIDEMRTAMARAQHGCSMSVVNRETHQDYLLGVPTDTAMRDIQTLVQQTRGSMVGPARMNVFVQMVQDEDVAGGENPRVEHLGDIPRQPALPPARGPNPQGGFGRGQRGGYGGGNRGGHRGRNYGGVQKNTAPRGARPLPPAAQQQLLQAAEVPRAKVCGNCGENGHELDICAHPSVDGYVYGCPFCNTKNHWREEDCPKRHKLPTNPFTILDWACTKRACRPPLAMYADWVDRLHLADDKPRKGKSMPKRFPWTPLTTTFQLSGDGPFPWEGFDYTRNQALELGPEDETANLRAVKYHYCSLIQLPGPSADQVNKLVPASGRTVSRRSRVDVIRDDPMMQENAMGRNVRWGEEQFAAEEEAAAAAAAEAGRQHRLDHQQRRSHQLRRNRR